MPPFILLFCFLFRRIHSWERIYFVLLLAVMNFCRPKNASCHFLKQRSFAFAFGSLLSGSVSYFFSPPNDFIISRAERSFVVYFPRIIDERVKSLRRGTSRTACEHASIYSFHHGWCCVVYFSWADGRVGCHRAFHLFFARDLHARTRTEEVEEASHVAGCLLTEGPHRSQRPAMNSSGRRELLFAAASSTPCLEHPNNSDISEQRGLHFLHAFSTLPIYSIEDQIKDLLVAI